MFPVRIYSCAFQCTVHGKAFKKHATGTHTNMQKRSAAAQNLHLGGKDAEDDIIMARDTRGDITFQK